MIRSEGIVVAIDPDRSHVWVEIPGRASACGSCSSAGGCHSGLLGAKDGARRFRVENRIAATLGDRVSLGVADGTVLRASWFSYLLPALLAIAAAGLGQHLADDAGAIAGTVLGLAIGFAYLRWMDRRMRRESMLLLGLDQPRNAACHLSESL